MARASRRVAEVVLFALAFVGLASERGAAQRTSSLSWVRLAGAEQCISTQALAQRVEARVGRRVFVSASQADLSLEGHVQREGDAMVARLAVSDPAGNVLGRRVLRVLGTHCEALEASLVLVIAIGIDPNASLPAGTRDPAGLSSETKTMLAQLELPKLTEQAVLALAVPEPGGARELADAAGETPPVRAPPRRPQVTRAPAAFEVGVHTGIGADFGVLPKAGFGFALRVTLHARALWPIEFSLAGLLPQSLPLATAASSGEFAFWAAGLALCPIQLEAQPIGLRACAGARAGQLSSHGQGFAQPLSAAAPWLDVSLQAGPSLRLGAHGRVDLTGRISFPIVRDTFLYEDFGRQQQRVHRAGAAVGGVELSAGLFF